MFDRYVVAAVRVMLGHYRPAIIDGSAAVVWLGDTNYGTASGAMDDALNELARRYAPPSRTELLNTLRCLHDSVAEAGNLMAAKANLANVKQLLDRENT